ncbi:MAG: MBL fold metallo-hydrolase [Bdellovibrionaceae bacterium]|nr:MBL fold metallo-hydrolase [Pseudobdellovibrionaceae bacterium]
MGFVVTFWGTRGSIPSGPTPRLMGHLVEDFIQAMVAKKHLTPSEIKSFLGRRGKEFLIQGTDTTCVSIESNEVSFVIDAGSGLRRFGDYLLKRRPQQKIHHIFFTHFHWDHLIGLPFFAPMFREDHEIHLYAVQAELEYCIKTKFSKPFFPVPFTAIAKRVHFHRLEPRKPYSIGGFHVTPYQLDHPDPCWGYKVEFQGCAYAHCVDTEGTRVSREDLGEDLPLYQNVQLLYFDAQYTLPELVDKANWGHSAAQVGLDIAIREGIPFVLFGHHDPNSHWIRFQQFKKQVTQYLKWRFETFQANRIQLPKVKWRFAYDGLRINMLKLKENIGS